MSSIWKQTLLGVMVVIDILSSPMKDIVIGML